MKIKFSFKKPTSSSRCRVLAMDPDSQAIWRKQVNNLEHTRDEYNEGIQSLVSRIEEAFYEYYGEIHNNLEFAVDTLTETRERVLLALDEFTNSKPEECFSKEELAAIKTFRKSWVGSHIEDTPNFVDESDLTGYLEEYSDMIPSDAMLQVACEPEETEVRLMVPDDQELCIKGGSCEYSRTLLVTGQTFIVRVGLRDYVFQNMGGRWENTQTIIDVTSLADKNDTEGGA